MVCCRLSTAAKAARLAADLIGQGDGRTRREEFLIMDTNFRKGELNRAFNVLFSKPSRWSWPETDVLSLLFEAWLTLEIASIFIKFHVGVENTLICAAALYVLGIANLNWDTVINGHERIKMRKKFVAPVQHTRAFGLLEDALDQRKKGCVPGMGGKKETDAKLRQLWYACFAEVAKLRVPTLANPLDVYTDDIVSNEPTASQIDKYLKTRTESVEELKVRLGQ